MDYVKYEIPTRENNMKDLLCSVTTPSNIHTYSVTTEYIRDWFLSHFKKDYFKKVHIDGKHAFYDFRRFSIDKLTKLQKPILAITPRMTFEYDRNHLDLHIKNMNLFFNSGLLDRAFYKNSINNSYLGLELEQLEIQYSFKIKLSTRAQQVDLYKYMKMAFGIGTTQTNYIDIDYHIPTYVILQIANDNGFLIENGKVVDIIAFLSFINMKSESPITYKFRTINGKSEYFLRYRNVPCHITMNDQLNADDGEREGQLETNFNIEMQTMVYMPSPRIFLYYSKKADNIYLIPKEDDTNIEDVMGFEIQLGSIPDVNSKGWNQYLLTDYLEENLDNLIEIDLKDMFEYLRILPLIDANNLIHVGSDIFMDFKIYNEGNEIFYTIDWTTYTLKFQSLVTNNTSTIAIYIDTNYVTNQLDENGELKTRYY